VLLLHEISSFHVVTIRRFVEKRFSKLAVGSKATKIAAGNLWSTRLPALFNLREDLNLLCIT
jgi:hypothetical protein